MEISKNILAKFQAGGAPAPGPEAGGDPLMQLAELAMQGLENNDCAALAAVAEGFLSFVQEASAGAPAPEQAPTGEAVFKKGGKILMRTK